MEDTKLFKKALEYAGVYRNNLCGHSDSVYRAGWCEGTMKMAGRYIFTTPVQEKYGGYPIVEGLKKVMSPDVSSEKDFILPLYLGGDSRNQG
jgi:hypothetical protein